jgi:hypothetical protein
MFTKKGKVSEASLLGIAASTLLVAGAAQAALVTLSGVVTNTTATSQTYEFSRKIRLTESMSNLGIFGSLSMVVTDFNRNGASVSSTSLGELYSGLFRGSEAKSFVPSTGGGIPGFALAAPARSMSRFESSFGSSDSPELKAGTLNIDDEIEVRLRFTLSAGDQVSYGATFNVISVPGPGAAAMALLAPWIGLHRRRRTENDS